MCCGAHAPTGQRSGSEGVSWQCADASVMRKHWLLVCRSQVHATAGERSASDGVLWYCAEGSDLRKASSSAAIVDSEAHANNGQHNASDGV